MLNICRSSDCLHELVVLRSIHYDRVDPRKLL